MFRILIADDEGIMRESLKHIIVTNFGSQCEVALAKSGREVIEQAETFKPDIAFVDIKMPGLNGIQAIEEVRKTNPSVVFIIITAYDKFSYAKEAVNLGVMEYITKPVGKNTVIDVCIRAMRKVDSERKKRTADLEIREKLEIVIPMIESGFIYSLLQDESGDSRENYLEMLEIKEKYAFIVVLEFGDEIKDGKLTNAVGANVRINKYYQQIKENIRDFFNCITGPVMGNRIVLFVPFEEEKQEYRERVEDITRLRNLTGKLEELLKLKIRAGIGRVMPSDKAKDSYQDALLALKEGTGRVAHILDIPTEKGYDGEYPFELESKYLQSAKSGDGASAVVYARDFFKWMEENSGGKRSNIEIKVLEMIIELEKRAFYDGNVSYGFRYRENYLSQIEGTTDNEALLNWFISKTEEICSKINNGKKKKLTSVVAKAKDYISENYAKNITLDEVSRMVDISPYYFSKLFKQETGEPFIEYMTKTRMREAERLLLNSDLSIKEICGACGYNDPNYFSRIFKKYEGITPGEFRNGRQGEV